MGIMKKVKYPFCVLNSPMDVKRISTIIPANGGENVIMELYDMLLAAKMIEEDENIIDKIYELDIKETF